MRTSNSAWWLAGLVTGGTGLATSYLAANLMNIRESPVVAVAELVIRLTPGSVAEWAIDLLGHYDKPVLLASILVILAALFVTVGWLARRRWWLAVVVLGAIAAFGVLAILTREGSSASDALPVIVGLFTWLLVLYLLTERLRRIDRLAEWAIDLLGHYDKPVLLASILVILAALFVTVGWLARRRWWLAVVVLGLIAAFGVLAILTREGSSASDAFPVIVGLFTWLLVLYLLTERLRRIDRLADLEHEAAEEPDRAEPVLTDEERHSRRGFLIGAGVIASVAGLVGVVGRIAGRGRREVERARRLLRLAGVSKPAVPPDATIGVDGVTSWMTPADEFYLIDTAVIVPTIEPKDWSLRIHGMVDREIEISYDELVARELTESWVTLNCVSNEVGGDLIGNAWWSGVRLADLLAEAGPHPDADAVLQTSDDGWTCGTPLSALTDDRNAMLAVAMNGAPLPIEHGFPVRTLVPGLYGYVSACKWVVDMEVSKFSEISAFWTEKGWGEQGPVKMSSRIDVPTSGDEVAAGDVTIAGMAWSQHIGISAVEVAVDGGEWVRAQIAGVPNDDTWVQWKAVVQVDEGDHMVKVRATDKDGLVQTGVVRDVLPDGSTGWHSVDFTAKT